MTKYFIISLSLLVLFSLISAQGFEYTIYPLQVGDIAVGDADNDGVNEVVIGYGIALGNSPAHNNLAYFTVYDYDSQNEIYNISCLYAFSSESPEPSVAIGDVDGDGNNELVLMNASPSVHFPPGAIRIYRYQNNDYELIWSDILSDGFRRISVGNIDTDPEAEIVIGNSFYDRTLYYYDYQGGSNWTKVTIEYVGEDCHGLQVADADNDGQNEIIAGLGVWPPYSVRIYKYLSGSIQLIWSYSFCSVSPYGPGYWLYVGDADNDGENEILVTEESPHQEGNDNDVFIFEHVGGTNWTLAWSIGFPWPNIGARCPYIGHIQNSSGNEFCFLSEDTVFVYRWNGSNYVQVASQFIENMRGGWPMINKIIGGDCDNDGEHETAILLGGNVYLSEGFPAGVGTAENNNLKPIRINSPFILGQNPFGEKNRIRYNLPKEGAAEIKILDIKGNVIRVLRTQSKAGQNEVIWDGRDETGQELPSGNYFYNLTQDGKLIGNSKAVKIK